tara:strand:+ start:1047 stop:1235 length:189 start_codon:yes stop_codon:yes gene_type:complete
MGGFGVLRSIGAFLIWIYKGYKVPYKDIRYNYEYPCFEVGLCFIAIIIISIFFLPDWLGLSN